MSLPIQPVQVPADSQLSPSPTQANAWKHGMYARKVLVCEEDQPAFEALRDALVAEWRPRSATAWMLVDHLAKLHWRLMRAQEAETHKLTGMQSRIGVRPSSDRLALPEVALAWDASSANSSLHRIQVFQMRLERSLHRVISQLITLRKERGKAGKLRAGRTPNRPAQPAAGPTVSGQT